MQPDERTPHPHPCVHGHSKGASLEGRFHLPVIVTFVEFKTYVVNIMCSRRLNMSGQKLTSFNFGM